MQILDPEAASIVVRVVVLIVAVSASMAAGADGNTTRRRRDRRDDLRESKEEKQKIQRDINVGGEHNFGQPAHPYQHVPGKFATNCSQQHRESLECIERNYHDRSQCEAFFAAYKACRKAENERRLEDNAKRPWF